MQKRLLIVIDMLNDFLELEGALPCGKSGRKIVDFVRAKLEEFAENDECIVFVMDSHEENDLEFNRFPRHCVKGTKGAQVIPELLKYSESKGVYKVTKTRYSSFYNTDMDEILREVSPEEVHIVGVCTNICVLYTAEELCNRDLKTIVYRQGVASFDQDAHRWALMQMENVLGAIVV